MYEYLADQVKLPQQFLSFGASCLKRPICGLHDIYIKFDQLNPGTVPPENAEYYFTTRHPHANKLYIVMHTHR